MHHWTLKNFILGCFLINNVVLVSGEQLRDPAVHIHVSILPQTMPPPAPHSGGHITLITTSSQTIWTFNNWLLWARVGQLQHMGKETNFEGLLYGLDTACITSFNNAAAAAKSLQSCPTLCDPVDGSPPGSPVPGILQARTLEWVAISFSSAWTWKVKVKSLSRVWLLATPWTAVY